MHVMLMFSYINQAGIVLNNFLILGIEEHDPTRMPIMPFSRSQRTKRNLAPGLKSLTRGTFKEFGQMINRWQANVTMEFEDSLRIAGAPMAIAIPCKSDMARPSRHVLTQM